MNKFDSFVQVQIELHQAVEHLKIAACIEYYRQDDVTKENALVDYEAIQSAISAVEAIIA